MSLRHSVKRLREVSAVNDSQCFKWHFFTWFSPDSQQLFCVTHSAGQTKYMNSFSEFLSNYFHHLVLHFFGSLSFYFTAKQNVRFIISVRFVLIILKNKKNVPWTQCSLLVRMSVVCVLPLRTCSKSCANRLLSVFLFLKAWCSIFRCRWTFFRPVSDFCLLFLPFCSRSAYFLRFVLPIAYVIVSSMTITD